MGLSRQAVQRLANEMVTNNLLVFNDNPHQKRAKLPGLTENGKNNYKKLEDKQKLGGTLTSQSALIEKIDK